MDTLKETNIDKHIRRNFERPKYGLISYLRSTNTDLSLLQLMIGQVENEQPRQQPSSETMRHDYDQMYSPTSIAARNNPMSSHFVLQLCDSFPNACSEMEALEQRFFHNIGNGPFQARGPKDLIAIISTMLATLLGAILVKLNVLVVLSLISVGIGKLLLLILAVKSKVFEHQSQHQQPVIYEKVYYPHNHYNQREYFSQLPQSYQEEQPSYAYSR